MLYFLMWVLLVVIGYLAVGLFFVLIPDYSETAKRWALYIENSYRDNWPKYASLDDCSEFWIDSCLAWPFCIAMRSVHLKNKRYSK
jgi:hypothetical protein